MSDALDYIIDALDEDVETATGRLLFRKELKAARACLEALRADLDSLREDEAGVADRVREAEAARDLLALARDEEEQAATAEEQLKQDMRRQDEAILKRVEGELKVYYLLIGLGFVVPPIVVAPFGSWCAFAVTFPLWGFARMYKAAADMQGRTWIVFMDGVGQIEKKVRFAHGMAVGSALLVVLWFVFAALRREVEGG